MPNIERSATVEPGDGPLLRLAELDAAINVAVKLLTPADAHAIRHELTTVAQTLRRIRGLTPSCRPARPVATRPTQSDLLG